MIRRLVLPLLAATACAATPIPYQSFEDVDYGFPKARTIWGERAKLDVHFVEIEGPQDRLPVILLHPWGFNLMVWTDVAPKIARSRRVVLVDLPGHGKSAKNAEAFSMKRMAAAILDVMDATGIERAIVGGNSLGGATSIATALAAPDRVAGLILVAAPGGRPFPEVMIRSTKQIATARQLETLSEEAWRIGLSAVPLGESPTALRLTEDLLAMRFAAEWSQWCRATTDILHVVAGYEPEVEKLGVPTLVVHGEDDLLITRSLNDAFVERIPNAKLAVMKDCGHMAEVECPDQLLPAVHAFLADLP